MKPYDARSVQSFRESFLAGWELLSRREKRLGVALTGTIVFEAALDALAVVAVYPFVGVLVQADLVETNRPIRMLHAWLGNPPAEVFLTRLGLAVIGLLTVAAAARWLTEYALSHYAAACQRRLSRDLLMELVAAPYAWLLMRNAASMSRLLYDDVGRWSRAFVLKVMTIFKSVVTVVVGGALVLVAAPLVGLLTLGVLGSLAAGLLILIRPRLSMLARRQRGALDQTMVTASQALSGIKDIKLSGREDHFVRLFASSSRTATRAAAKLKAWNQLSPIAVRLLGQVGLLAVALVLLRTGRASGEIAALMALLVLVTPRVVPAVSLISTSVSQVWNVYPFLEGIGRLRSDIEIARLEQVAPQPSVWDPWGPSWERLELKGLAYSYPETEDPAVDQVSLELRSGRAYGLAGRSGAGKSTLVDLMLGLLTPGQGEILVDGRRLTSIDPKDWQRQIGHVPQVPYIADDTLRANVAFGVPRKDVDDEWVHDCLGAAHLLEWCRSLERGLDTPLGERGTRASGGQRQRIAIARALFNRPQLLILDEATSALDSISESAVQEAIETLRGRITTITIAHRLSTIAHCDEIFLLDAGHLAARGSFDQLRAASSLFRRLAADRERPREEATLVDVDSGASASREPARR